MHGAEVTEVLEVMATALNDQSQRLASLRLRNVAIENVIFGERMSLLRVALTLIARGPSAVRRRVDAEHVRLCEEADRKLKQKQAAQKAKPDLILPGAGRLEVVGGAR